MTVTSFDVAKLAEVSQPTVSRVMRGMKNVSPEKTERVLAAAKQLGYVPSYLARTLSIRKTNRVAIISAEITNPYYPELIHPLLKELEGLGYKGVLIADKPAYAESPQSINELIDGSYDGIIITTARFDSSLPLHLTRSKIPHVLVNRTVELAAQEHAQQQNLSVVADNADGMKKIVEFLHGHGHREVGVIHGPRSTSTGSERAQALLLALAQKRMTLESSNQAHAEFSHEAGFEAASNILQQPARPTAIVCANDVIAFGAISAAKSLGIKVPEELTITGFDDISMARWPAFGLTTVRVDLQVMAKESVKLLHAAISGSTKSVNTVLPVEVVARKTHGQIT